jgi:hypothetical protein
LSRFPLFSVHPKPPVDGLVAVVAAEPVVVVVWCCAVVVEVDVVVVDCFKSVDVCKSTKSRDFKNL